MSLKKYLVKFRNIRTKVLHTKILHTTSKIISPKYAAETLEQLLVRLFHITTLITDHQVED